MRKSNKELWDGARLLTKDVMFNEWDDWSTASRRRFDAFADAVRADEAENAKAEQRQECAEAACKHMATMHRWQDGSFIDGLTDAIRNAGKAPVLKPGMLAVGLKYDSHYPFTWPENYPCSIDKYRPLTRAEIMVLHDKAPE